MDPWQDDVHGDKCVRSTHGRTVASYVRTLGDVNGDGRANLMGFGLNDVYFLQYDGFDGYQ